MTAATAAVNSPIAARPVRSATTGRRNRRSIDRAGEFPALSWTVPRSVVSQTAINVVNGTAATIPRLPTRVRTISIATSSPLMIRLVGCRLTTKSTMSGRLAPRYARNSVFTVAAMWERPTLNALA